MKYKLNYRALNSEIECLEFRSAKKRAAFIADKVIVIDSKVFTLVIYYFRYPDFFDVYVFDDWFCISEIVYSKYEEFCLFEWASYEDAYKYALKLREYSPLCYTKTMK